MRAISWSGSAAGEVTWALLDRSTLPRRLSAVGTSAGCEQRAAQAKSQHVKELLVCGIENGAGSGQEPQLGDHSVAQVTGQL